MVLLLKFNMRLMMANGRLPNLYFSKATFMSNEKHCFKRMAILIVRKKMGLSESSLSAMTGISSHESQVDIFLTSYYLMLLNLKCWD